MANKTTVIDLSSLSETERRVVKAILLLKLQALSSLVDARKPLLIVFPEIDGVFHDDRMQRPSPRAARTASSPVMAGTNHLITRNFFSMIEHGSDFKAFGFFLALLLPNF
ncbi:MAG TPA: hypothetical protein VKM55_12900 [Candidatus Lokiarchaeia archaeon]|nr:hypothetical protein [Candidatus Lokiarchaeia archaeon]